MTQVEDMAAFVAGCRFERLSPEAVDALKGRVLDSLGCAIGALEGPPIRMIQEQIADFGGQPLATLVGGGRTAPDRAALYNGALVRYLDFNDSFLAKGETCHPSDNLGAVLAACEYRHTDGRELLAALAVAYQVQCVLSEAAPVRHRGFDHTTQGAYACAAGVARALALSPEQTAHAIAICGTANINLRVSRTGRLSHWKGLAYPNVAFNATHGAFLAMRGVTGPLEVFEGKKGFAEAVAGTPVPIAWDCQDLEAVRRTIVKKYNAEIHSQSALEGLQELRRQHRFTAADVAGIELTTFQVAYDIIGGGVEGGKHVVATKEEADHSLPYMLAVILLDGELTPAQYAAERIRRADVQQLMSAIVVKPEDSLSARFPDQMPARLRVHLRDGRELSCEKRDYEGFHTHPMSWESLVAKFHRLASPFAEAALRSRIVATVADLDGGSVTALTGLLAQVREEGVQVHAGDELLSPERPGPQAA